MSRCKGGGVGEMAGRPEECFLVVNEEGRKQVVVKTSREEKEVKRLM